MSNVSSTQVMHMLQLILDHGNPMVYGQTVVTICTDINPHSVTDLHVQEVAKRMGFTDLAAEEVEVLRELIRAERIKAHSTP